MLITYFDEVKYQPDGNQKFYWLAGITVPDSLVPELEAQAGSLAKECFGTSVLTRETEFHATDIMNRTRNFKSWGDIGKRLDVLKRLMKIIDRHGNIFKTYVRIDPALRVKTGDLEQQAFVFLVEKIDELLKVENSLGLLIGDFDTDRAASAAVQDLSRYRSGGTPYYFGREIKKLIDTVHFTHSHLSRLLQLADVYAWVQQFAAAPNDGKYPRGELLAFIRQDTKLLSPSKYKQWPTSDSWYQVTSN